MERIDLAYLNRDDLELLLLDKVAHVEALRAELVEWKEACLRSVAQRGALEGALREIEAGPYNGFEQCRAIARAALAGEDT